MVSEYIRVDARNDKCAAPTRFPFRRGVCAVRSKLGVNAPAARAGARRSEPLTLSIQAVTSARLHPSYYAHVDTTREIVSLPCCYGVKNTTVHR